MNKENKKDIQSEPKDTKDNIKKKVIKLSEVEFPPEKEPPVKTTPGPEKETPETLPLSWEHEDLSGSSEEKPFEDQKTENHDLQDI